MDKFKCFLLAPFLLLKLRVLRASVVNPVLEMWFLFVSNLKLYKVPF